MNSRTTMTKAEIEMLRGVMLVNRERLAWQVDELNASHRELIEVLVSEVPDDEHDPDATTAFERAQLRSLINDAQQRLAKLDKSIAMLDRDGFGLCLACGKSIGIDRLLARPESTHCVSCSAPPPRSRLARRT